MCEFACKAPHKSKMCVFFPDGHLHCHRRQKHDLDLRACSSAHEFRIQMLWRQIGILSGGERSNKSFFPANRRYCYCCYRCKGNEQGEREPSERGVGGKFQCWAEEVHWITRGDVGVELQEAALIGCCVHCGLMVNAAWMCQAAMGKTHCGYMTLFSCSFVEGERNNVFRDRSAAQAREDCFDWDCRPKR